MDAPANIREQFTELNTALKDIEKTWRLDLSEILDSYIDRLSVGSFNGQEYVEVLDFIEAALLVEYSTQLYSKKVDYFIRTAWELLENLKSCIVESGSEVDGEPPRTVPKRRSTARQSLDIDELNYSTVSTNEKIVDGENNALKSCIKFFPPKSKYAIPTADRSGRRHILFDSRGDSMPNRYEFRGNWRTSSNLEITDGHCIEDVNEIADLDRTDNECLDASADSSFSSVRNGSNTLLELYAANEVNTTASDIIQDSDTLPLSDQDEQERDSTLFNGLDSSVNNQNSTLNSLASNELDTDDLDGTQPISPLKEADVIAHSTPVKDRTTPSPSNCLQSSENNTTAEKFANNSSVLSQEGSESDESDKSEETDMKIEDILKARISGNDDEMAVSFKDLWTPINVSTDISDRILRRRSQAHSTSCQCGEETHSHAPLAKVENHCVIGNQEPTVEQHEPNAAECQEPNVTEQQEHNVAEQLETNADVQQESLTGEHQELNASRHQELNTTENQESTYNENREHVSAENQEHDYPGNQKSTACDSNELNTADNPRQICVSVKISAAVQCILRVILRKHTKSRVRQPEPEFVADTVEELNRRREMLADPSRVDGAREEKEDFNRVSTVDKGGFNIFRIGRTVEHHCSLQSVIRNRKDVLKMDHGPTIQARRDNNNNPKLKSKDSDSAPLLTNTADGSDSAPVASNIDINSSPVAVVNNADDYSNPTSVGVGDDIVDSGYKSGREDTETNGETDLVTHLERQTSEGGSTADPGSEREVALEENMHSHSDADNEDIYHDEDNLAESFLTEVCDTISGEASDEVHQEQDIVEDIQSESSDHFNREPSVFSDLYDDSEYFTSETQNADHADDYKKNMDERVSHWQTHVEPFLLSAEERSNFKVEKYCKTIIDFLPSENERVSFHDFMEGRSGNDVSRYLSSSLVLANYYEVEISRPGNEDLAADDFELTRLNGVSRFSNLQDQGSPHVESRKRVSDPSHSSSGKKAKQSPPIVNGQLGTTSKVKVKHKESYQNSNSQKQKSQNKRPQYTNIVYDTPTKKFCVNNVKRSVDKTLNVNHTPHNSPHRRRESVLSSSEQFISSDSETDKDDDILQEILLYNNPKRVLFPVTNREHSTSGSRDTSERGREGSPQPGPSWRY